MFLVVVTEDMKLDVGTGCNALTVEPAENHHRKEMLRLEKRAAVIPGKQLKTLTNMNKHSDLVSGYTLAPLLKK